MNIINYMTSDLKTDYNNISDELFEVNIICKGTSDIVINFDDMINFDWDKLNLNIIKKYKYIYNEFIKNSYNKSKLINNINIQHVLPYIQLFLPENYIFIKKKIILIWINKYNLLLDNIYTEDKFDLSWYDYSSSDYKWAYTRMKNIDKINEKINKYLLNIKYL